MHGSNQERRFELVHIFLCHDSGTGIDERRYRFASNHLHKRTDAEFPDFLWELRDRSILMPSVDLLDFFGKRIESNQGNMLRAARMGDCLDGSERRRSARGIGRDSPGERRRPTTMRRN